MTIKEHLESLRKSRKAAQDKMNEVAEKSMDEGRSMNSGEQEEFDTLRAEIETLDSDIKRFSQLAKIDEDNAKSVEDDATDNANKGINPVSGKSFRMPKNTQKLDAGIAFARAAKCLALGHMQSRDAREIAKDYYGDNEQIVSTTARLVTKAAVPAATTTDPTWAGALVGDEGDAFADFIEYLRPRTILGQFGQGSTPSLRSVPFRTPLIGQTSGGDGYWVGEGAPKPLTQFDFTRTTLEPNKVANIAVATMEVIRDSNPAADTIIRDQLAAALTERLDLDFIDPTNSGTTNIKPASILNGAVSVASSGSTADNVRTDMQALFGAFIAANNAPTSGVWIMSSTTALALSMMMNNLGQPEFPGIGMTGGTLFGLPVIVSEYVPGDSSGAIVALVNARDIYLADEGGIDVSMSGEASLQMSNTPSAGAQQLVSLWQNNLVGFRAERTINWAPRRDQSVAYLTGVNWG